MTLNTVTVGAAVTPTVLQTYASHYLNRKSLHQKPTAHISYHEGLQLVRAFLNHASHHTVEELQAFTAQWVPHPRWVRLSTETIPSDIMAKAADILIHQLGHKGIDKIGGSKWWQWRRKDDELKAEWIEMRGDYNTCKKQGAKAERIMLYVHGGAYFFGSVDEHRYQMQRHARKLRARVFAPRYRLAPQFPFPCGLQDCLAAYLYLLATHKPSEIVLAGDSAGGGMIVSVLVMLRDQGLPIPAGAILISPWVDLTHSFPSVAGGSEFDYIPAHGFMQKPSASWPPPNEDEMQEIVKDTIAYEAKKAMPSKSVTSKERKRVEEEAVQGFSVHHDLLNATDEARNNPNNPAGESDENPVAGNTIPGPRHHLSIRIDDDLVIVKDQIQMYTTNQLVSHPLVSPVLQPSLGGLPPLLIVTGGGEVLRDEQIYLAHKAANPAKYPPGEAYLDEYDPDRTLLQKYKPTNVQLQVWDDLCHVAPTLSFTKPAKFMYRSIAQFGAWALARAQGKGIEILDDDDVSVISSGSDTDTDSDDTSEKPSAKRNHVQQGAREETAQVGVAGSPLPAFKNHIIRQRVDRHGVIYPLAPAHALPALQMAPSDVGVIKPGPVQSWLVAKKQWDVKYAKEKRQVQKTRVIEMKRGLEEYGAGETPPPSALAGRRQKGGIEAGYLARKKKSYGMMLWSHWGGKHDESTIKREEEMLSQEERASLPVVRVESAADDEETEMSTPVTPSRRKSQAGKKGRVEERGQSRRRTITVTDTGQTEGIEDGSDLERLRKEFLAKENLASTEHPTSHSESEARNQGPDPIHLTPGFLSKTRDLTPLKPDDASIATRTTGATDLESLGNVSTTAVFSAPVVMNKPRHKTKASSSSNRLSVPYLGSTAATHPADDDTLTLRSDVGSIMSGGWGHDGRPDTPSSARSLERLQNAQLDVEGQNSRSRSNIAVMGVAGVVEPMMATATTTTGRDADGASSLSSKSSKSSSHASSSSPDHGLKQQQQQRDRAEAEASTAQPPAAPNGTANHNDNIVAQKSKSEKDTSLPSLPTHPPPPPKDALNPPRDLDAAAQAAKTHNEKQENPVVITAANAATTNTNPPAAVTMQQQRPNLYNRSDTQFQTAREQL